MGNLGLYQMLTTVAKKVGGPKILVLLIATSGYVVIRTIEASGKIIYKFIIEHTGGAEEMPLEEALEYEVIKNGTSNDGIEFHVGDKLQILQQDKESVLVNRIKDQNSPYFISEEFLNKISSYRLDSQMYALTQDGEDAC